MANGDKDDKKKKKQPADDKNVRVIRPQGSGAVKSVQQNVKDVKDFFKKAVTTVPVEAPQGYDLSKTIGDVVMPTSTDPIGSSERYDESNVEQDLLNESLDKRRSFFAPMGRGTVTEDITDTTPSKVKDVGSGPFGKQEISSVGKQDWEIEAEKFDKDQKATIAAFDTDNDGVLSDQERDDQKAFNRENLLTSFRERKERAEAQLAEINARTPTIDSDATRAAMQAAAPAKTQEDGGPKFGALGSMAQYFTELGKKGKSAPLSKNLVTSGLRRKDFASDEGFLAAVKNKNSSSQRLGAGSSLRKTPRELGSLSGAMNRAGRRLLRKGASGEAQKMFGAAERQRLTEGSNISTPERRAREEAERRQGAQLMADMQKMMEDYKKMRSNIGIAGSPDSNIQQSSRNTYGSRL